MSCIQRCRCSNRFLQVTCAPRSSNGGMSVDIKKSIEEAQLVAVDFVTTPKWIGSVIFKASSPRSLRLLVGYDPLADNLNHGEIWGAFSKAKSKSIQQASQWFV